MFIGAHEFNGTLGSLRRLVFGVFGFSWKARLWTLTESATLLTCALRNEWFLQLLWSQTSSRG